jgi:hypothetical protein
MGCVQSLELEENGYSDQIQRFLLNASLSQVFFYYTTFEFDHQNNIVVPEMIVLLPLKYVN